MFLAGKIGKTLPRKRQSLNYFWEKGGRKGVFSPHRSGVSSFVKRWRPVTFYIFVFPFLFPRPFGKDDRRSVVKIFSRKTFGECAKKVIFRVSVFQAFGEEESLF